MKILINNRAWEIKQVKADHEYLDGACGATVFQDSIIYINKDISSDLKKDTILHELCHSYLFVLGFNQFPDGKFTEENVCDFFGSFSFELVQVAKKIFRSWKLS